MTTQRIQFNGIFSQFGGSQFNGDTSLTGSISTTLVDDVVNASGEVSTSGNMSTTLVDDIVNASGEVSTTGNISTTLVDDVVLISGSTLLTGNISTTLVDDVVNAVGNVVTPGSGLNTNVIIAEFNKIVNDQIDEFVLNPSQVSSLMSTSYYSESKNGIILGANVATGGVESLLDDAFLGDNTPTVVNNMAQSVNDYWHSIPPGTPTHGGSVVISVTTNLTSVNIESAIIEIMNNPPTNDGIGNLLNAINDTVQAATFFITENVSGTPTVFEEHLT